MARRLVRVGREHLTIVRQRRGKSFCFRDETGALVCDAEEKKRFLALGIPPAWTDVRIAVHPRAHIQALGVDGSGRLQYVYHADWEQKRDSKKLGRLQAMTQALPRLRRRIKDALNAETGTRELALAIAVALIDRTAMRIGREKYLETSGTRGAGTLFAKDVRVNGDEVCLSFDAKSGKRAEYCFNDAAVADAVSRILTLPGKRLLVYKDDTGKVRPIKTNAINEYLRELTGAEISAKDFRTLHASALAGEALAQLEVGTSVSARRRQINGVAKQVAETLRNTPAICRKSYIAPCLFKLFDEGKLGGLWSAAGKGRPGLLTREKRLSAVLASVG